MGDMSHHRYLQELNLSHNFVEVMEGLSELKFLRVLKLNHNKITKVDGLDGEAKHHSQGVCTREAQDQLTRLFHLQRLSTKQSCVSASHLPNLPGSSVERMPLPPPPVLALLAISEGLPLVELHLDYNLISKLENVGSDKLPNLRVLRLGFNAIESISNLKGCFALAVLNIRFNK